MLTKEVWLIKKLKNSLGLLIFCGGCADLMPFSTYLCKKSFLSRTERFGTFLFCFLYRQSRIRRAKSLLNGGLSFLPNRRKIEPVTTHKMAPHLMDMNIIFQENINKQTHWDVRYQLKILQGEIMVKWIQEHQRKPIIIIIFFSLKKGLI